MQVTVPWLLVATIFFCFCQTYELPDPVRILLRSGTDREDRKFWKRFGRQNEFYKELGESNVYSQGAKKIIFTACHLGKLKLAFTSPEIISTSPKSFLTSRIDFTVLFCSNSLKNSTYPSGRLRTKITRLIAKSTTHGLSDTTFFACWQYFFITIDENQLLVFSVTPFKIDKKKNQNDSIDKVQNLGKERR